MPERPLTIATYAAGASLAAITLIYVFGPTFFFDDDAANSSRSSRKKSVVGLANPANDCFINSVLQALAGLPELRLYLIRETHRRKLDGAELYQDLAVALEEQAKKQGNNRMPEWKLLSLQQGLVTAGLKEILDALNERPIYKKTISAQHFIQVVEQAFRTRISRSQQDAQEFLQIVAERLDDENHAARRVRRREKEKVGGNVQSERGSLDPAVKAGEASSSPQTVLEMNSISPARPRDSKLLPNDDDNGETAGVQPDTRDPAIRKAEPDEESKNDTEGELHIFPFEGKLESQVECSHCAFKPKPHASSFVTLTLHAPQSSGSLNSCFDGMFKQEQIDDFTCDRCRLDHALQVNRKLLSKTGLSSEDREKVEQDNARIEEAIREDPEKPPKDVKLPDLATAPKRRISRHMRISDFPRIMSLHLSRSVWDGGHSSSKNTSKVTFPETLSLGGLLDRKTYRLLAVVTHKGGHNSGHYETFRRQFLSAPYSTPASMGTGGIYSVRSSPAPSPQFPAAIGPNASAKDSAEPSPTSDSRPISSATLDHPSTSSSNTSSSQSQSAVLDRRKESIPLEAMPTPGLPPLPQEKTDSSPADGDGKRQSSLITAANRIKRRKGLDRWWRISDDKIKECKTSDVLGMQREVYLLFYELVVENG